MADWRLDGDFNFLKNKSLSKIVFPEYWHQSYNTHDLFYNLIKKDGETFVKKYGRGKEYLVGDKIQDFWHEHCVFCTDKITTRDNRICYCADNFSVWICQNCFNDFKNIFNWNIE